MVTALTVKLLREIKHLRGQLVAIILVIGCGIGTYVMSRSMHASLLLTQQAYYEQGRYADLFVRVHRAPKSLLRPLAEIDGVAIAESRTVENVLVDVPGLEEPATATVLSMPTRYRMMLNDIHLVAGRRVAPNGLDEVVLYAPFAEANGLHIGDSLAVVLNGTWRSLCVVGTAISPEFVIVMNPGTLMLDSKRIGVLWMAEEALEAAFDMRGAWNSVVMRLYPGASANAVIASVDGVMRRYGGQGTTQRDEQVSHRFLTDEIRQLEVTAIVIPMIFLGVAIFLLNIALARLVATQRPTIAILKAFGYSNVAIATHYIGFAVVAVTGGAVLGVAIGYVAGLQLSELYMQFYRFPMLVFRLPSDVLLVSIGISLLAAVAGALTAVRAAVMLPPADAMRPQSPRTFRPGLLEQTGILGRASPATMIVLRNIERRKLRSIIAVGMIALATSILVLGRFMFDVMDRMISISFDRAMREDVTVTLSAPVSGGARHSLQHMPGVLRTEPFRMVPVDILGKSDTHTTTLTSVVDGAMLHRVTDTEGRFPPMPNDGLMLTEYLATKLGFVVGDSVTIVVREGQRDTHTIPLAATVREMIGAQAYMARQALSRLLDEQHTMSGAYLAVDSAQLPAFLKQAKRTPVIAESLVRTVALQSFQDVYVQNVWISSIYIVVLSCVIAFGVVYNSARIALSERVTELASLRILGMSTAEITAILLGEQGVLTVVGIPLGIAMGAAGCRWIVDAIEMEYLRLVYVFTAHNAGVSALTIAAVTVVTAIMMHRRLVRLDLIAVLKERE